MKERINRLAKGILDTDIPRAVIMPEKIEEIVQAGKTASMEFHVNSINGLYIKGLAYTDHMRVTVENTSFGGLRNRIFYQVDTRYLKNGDTIQGTFELVTDGGELKLPFTFHVRLGASGQTLAGLKTAEDFAALAKEKPDTALRLFHYQDFAETAFLQDMHVRAVYDGLNGHGEWGNQLEEFLVALGVKEPVTFCVEENLRKYDYPTDPVEDMIEIEKDRWGYVSIEAQTDGDFLELPKKHFESQDFQDNCCKIPYRILPERLHKGKNFGGIRFNTAKESWTIRFQVEGDKSYAEGRHFRRALCRFAQLKLKEACGLSESASLRRQILQELDVMRSVPGDKNLASLWMADTLLGSGKKKQASFVLEECRDEVLMARKDQVEQYCFYQYLSQQVQSSDGQKESLLRLVRKYLSEGSHPFLFFIRLKLEEGEAGTPLALLAEMRTLYEEGFHSPFLYLYAFRIVKAHPEFLQGPDDFLLQVLNFAAKKEMIEEELAVQISEIANTEKHYHKWLHRLLVLLYQRFPVPSILEAICGIMIKGEYRSQKDFAWYEQALKSGISLTRLYEYFLYSLPENYQYLLPKEVLLYFSYGHDLDWRSRSVLYENILKYMNPASKLYPEYERDMEEFALEQLFQSRINSRLATIYDRMILKDMIDEPIAQVLPAVLRSFKITCKNKQMKYVIVRYEELTQEDAYLLIDGVAYVPLFSDKTVILFQDAFGNRYGDVRHLKTPVMDKPELEKRCFEVNPEHPMLCLAACREIAALEKAKESEVRILERAMKELPIHPLYRKILLAKIIGYYRKLAGGEDAGQHECSYLLTLDTKAMSLSERILVCETLISQNYLKEACQILKTYGTEGMNLSRLAKLCRNAILQKHPIQDTFLLKLSFQVFLGGKADSVILRYLSEQYNGNSNHMFKILSQAASARVELDRMGERLLCQMMFSGNTKYLDQTFEIYSHCEKMNPIAVKAYFTVKSIGYFLKHETADKSVFSYLESTINKSVDAIGTVPVISLLALTRYYSECRTLKEDQKVLCKQITDYLISEGLIFPYTKKLSAFISIPSDILDKAMICFEGRREDNLDLFVRILPDEKKFRRETLKRVYQGIFVCQQVLFEGETLEYQVFRLNGSGGRTQAAEGKLTCELAAEGVKGSRYASLNDMELCLTMKEETGLKKSMKEYLIKNAALEELFPLAP